MHAKQIGRHRSLVRATDRRHSGSHRNTQNGRFRLDWTWGALVAWMVSFYAAATRTAKHAGPLFRAPQMLRGIRFMDALAAPGLPADRWAPVVQFSANPSWANPTMASIQATPWGDR